MRRMAAKQPVRVRSVETTGQPDQMECAEETLPMQVSTLSSTAIVVRSRTRSWLRDVSLMVCGGAICLLGGWIGMRVPGAQTRSSHEESFATNFTANGTVFGCCYQGWAGMAFTIGPDPIKVVQLGRWVLRGNRIQHELKMVNAATKQDVPGSSIALQLSNCKPEHFCFVSLPTPVTLSARTRYYLVSSEKAVSEGGDNDAFYAHDALVRTSGIATKTNGVFLTGKGWMELDVQNASYGPVSFRYIHQATE
jgi:hypothetical protein